VAIVCGCKCRPRLSVIDVSSCEYCVDSLPPTEDYIVVTGMATTRILRQTGGGAPCRTYTHYNNPGGTGKCIPGGNLFFGEPGVEKVTLTINTDCSVITLNSTFSNAYLGSQIPYNATLSPGWTSATIAYSGQPTITITRGSSYDPPDGVYISGPVTVVYGGTTYTMPSSTGPGPMCGSYTTARTYNLPAGSVGRVACTWYQSADASTITATVTVYESTSFFGAPPEPVLFTDSETFSWDRNWMNNLMPLTIGGSAVLDA
jgi:hypothetical protein